MMFAGITNTQSLGSIVLQMCGACLLVAVCLLVKYRVVEKGEDCALKDEPLYEQGQDRPEADFCPICTLPIALPMSEHSMLNPCCMKSVCNGCVVAAHQREQRGMDTCEFCRTTIPGDDASRLLLIQKRIEAGDADAMEILANKYHYGKWGLEKDVKRAMNLRTKAAELGSLNAHFNLGLSFFNGEGAEQDHARAVNHLQYAAMKGHAESRSVLGFTELYKMNHHLAVKHFLISAKMGEKIPLDVIKKMFMDGIATKAQYADALRGYQDAVEETKSHQREEAKLFLAKWNWEETRKLH